MHSRFRFWTFFIVALLLSVTGLLVYVSLKILERPGVLPFPVIIFLAVFTFTWIWLVFGELRTKAIKVRLEGEEIITSNYLGLGRQRVYSFSEFDGFETALLPSDYATYEYLYLVKNGKKVVKISQFYHSNYADLKNTLTGKVRNLGHKGFSYIQEIKEIFT